MLYFASPSTPPIRAAIDTGQLGALLTPARGNQAKQGWVWAADNGAFTGTWRPSQWLSMLERNQPFADGCRFVAIPDRLCDPVETNRLWDRWAPIVADMGLPCAYVLQDGVTDSQVPWSELDCVFVGGSTAFKLGDDAHHLAVKAHHLDKWVHWGRVNSRRRVTHAWVCGDSVDGTQLVFRPDIYLPQVLAWMSTLPQVVPPLHDMKVRL